jgi:hypothetical protein
VGQACRGANRPKLAPGPQFDKEFKHTIGEFCWMMGISKSTPYN